MPDSNAIKHTKRGGGLAAPFLIWSGVILLIAGGLLTYPYVGSRLSTFPLTPTPTPTAALPTATFSPSPT
ncbi:MAG TPA: hypothetical protein ENN99_04975, partial [Chloroflexi bacterium]|nr:hypothetical protein [Chloroflexota bacterium]